MRPEGFKNRCPRYNPEWRECRECMRGLIREECRLVTEMRRRREEEEYEEECEE